MKWEEEYARIRNAYRDMNQQLQREQHFFSFRDSAHVYRLQNRYRDALYLLLKVGVRDISGLRILDVGCGDGRMLREFLQWGAQPENLAGIDLRQEPVDQALRLSPNFDIRCASAIEIPWPDNSFDFVCQHTVFSSILDWEMKHKIAAEMLRVVRKTGLILWYDFWLNPTNPYTRGIRPTEIKRLFPDCRFYFKRITLAPPIARKLAPISWGLCGFLESLKIFNTHYLVIIRPLDTENP